MPTKPSGRLIYTVQKGANALPDLRKPISEWTRALVASMHALGLCSHKWINHGPPIEGFQSCARCGKVRRHPNHKARR